MNNSSPVPNKEHRPPPPEPNNAERTWAMIAHMGTFLGYYIPYAQLLVPLGIWLGQKGHSAFVDHHAKESLNFQLPVTLVVIVARAILATQATQNFPALAYIMGFVYAFIVYSVIVAAWQANKGKFYRYYVSLRLIN